MPLSTILRRGRSRREPLAPAADLDIAPDRDLLDRFAHRGDQQAFAALVRRHGPPVLGVCRRVLRDPHAAEDAFQSTFMVLACKAHAISRPEALGSWLYGVAVRVACKARAGVSHPTPAPLLDPAAHTADPSAGLASQELRLILDEELGRMPRQDRDLIVLVYLEGKTHDEAARAVGCPLGSVAWRLTRARESLRRRLARRGVTLSVGALLLLASVGRAQAVSGTLVGRAAAAAAAKEPVLHGTAPVFGRRIPLGCLLPLGLLLVAGLITGGWAAVDHGRKTSKPAATAPAAASADTAACGRDAVEPAGCCGAAGDSHP
jgi:RNA polymerase sigma factor (sigma-70 family)